MSLYAGNRTKAGAMVAVDGDPLELRLDLRSHSPTGFDWGCGGSGAAQHDRSASWRSAGPGHLLPGRAVRMRRRARRQPGRPSSRVTGTDVPQFRSPVLPAGCLGGAGSRAAPPARP